MEMVSDTVQFINEMRWNTGHQAVRRKEIWRKVEKFNVYF